MRPWTLLVLVATFSLTLMMPMATLGRGPAVKPVNLETLNTEDDEEDPYPTPDHNAMYYATNARGSYDIYLAKKAKGSPTFGQGKPLIADKAADERSPFYYKDRLYFASNQVRDPKLANLKNFDLMSQIGTQAPLFVPGDVNSKADEMYAYISPSGKEMYFSRKTEKGWKLYDAKGPTPGPIGKAREGTLPFDFHRATITSTGLTMYLQGPLEGGKIGIYRCKRSSLIEAWSKPEPLAALNHAESKKGDMQPALSADGARLYFVSDRPGGKGGLDIWYVLTAQLK